MNTKSKHPLRGLAVCIILTCIFSCSHNEYASSNRVYKKRVKELTKTIRQYPLQDSAGNAPFWAGTVNFDLRKPNFVIIHHTAQNSCEQTLKAFTMDKSKVSAHYVICKDGTVHHMLNDYLRAWQAGLSRWGNATDINSISIGIEIDNNGFEPFTDQQIGALLGLLTALKKAYNIPTANFIGHADIAPGRKVDPNRYFPWKILAEQGFGLWYDTTCVVLPPMFDSLQALHNIGYDIRRPEDAIQSFKLHFIQDDTTKILTEDDKKILYDLSIKYLQ